MSSEAKALVSPDAVPLRGAVLCMDCECVTTGLSDECLVCGSRSLLNVERMLGGANAASRPRPAENLPRYDVEINLSLERLETRELNSVLETIRGLILPFLLRGEGRFHLDVNPQIDSRADSNTVESSAVEPIAAKPSKSEPITEELPRAA